MLRLFLMLAVFTGTWQGPVPRASAEEGGVRVQGAAPSAEQDEIDRLRANLRPKSQVNQGTLGMTEPNTPAQPTVAARPAEAKRIAPTQTTTDASLPGDRCAWLRGPEGAQRFTFEFASGSATIKPIEAPCLRAVAKAIEPFDCKYVVEGHTDTVGSVASNLALSGGRSESVVSGLTQAVAALADRLIPIGKGKAPPLRVETRDETNEPKNRYAAIFLAPANMQPKPDQCQSLK